MKKVILVKIQCFTKTSSLQHPIPKSVLFTAFQNSLAVCQKPSEVTNNSTYLCPMLAVPVVCIFEFPWDR